MDLKEGELHIWRYAVDEKEYLLEKTHPLLSDEEKKRCSNYINEAEKIRYTCNHRFVRKVLAKYLNIPASDIKFSIAELGKPFVKNSNLFFSYSYRTTFALLAISKDAEVGVDIEKIKVLQDAPTFASFSFSEKEKEIIFKADAENFQDTLFTFWTFKEAIIKALGVGLNADLTRVDLSDFFFSEQHPLAFDHNNRYTIKALQTLPGYKAAFAIKGEVNNLIEYDYAEN